MTSELALNFLFLTGGSVCFMAIWTALEVWRLRALLKVKRLEFMQDAKLCDERPAPVVEHVARSTISSLRRSVQEESEELDRVREELREVRLKIDQERAKLSTVQLSACMAKREHQLNLYLYERERQLAQRPIPSPGPGPAQESDEA